MTGEVKKKRVATDMTQGNPAKLICLFALPLLFGNVLQQLYVIILGAYGSGYEVAGFIYAQF